MLSLTFTPWFKTNLGDKTKIFRSDNACDYVNQILTPCFQKEGIIHELSCVNTPQQNEVSEWKNGHLLNATQALLFPRNVLTTTYMINKLPSQILDFKTPLETLAKFYPHVRTSTGLIPRLFDCTSFVHVHSQNREKLDPRAIKYVFIGYSFTQKGYKWNEDIRGLWETLDVLVDI